MDLELSPMQFKALDFPKMQSFAELSEAIHLLENYVFTTDTTHWPTDYITKCNNIYGRWEKELEKHHTLAILHDEIEDWKKYPLYERFKRLIQREVSLIEGIKPKKLLFIGGGYFPISPIFYAKDYNTHCTSIDYDQDACLLAHSLVKKLGLLDKIDIFCEKGETFTETSYDLFIVSLLAFPKKEILKNILKKIDPKIPIICRTSEKSRTLLYKPLRESDLHGWSVLKKAEARFDDTISSLLLKIAEFS